MKICANKMYHFFLVVLVLFLCQITTVHSYENSWSNHKISKRAYDQVRSHWNKKNYDNLGKWLSKNIGKQINLSELYKIAVDIKAKELMKSVSATKNILAKCKDIKMSKGEILQLALFIETDLKKKVKQKQYYFDAKKNNLPRTIEVDPKNGNIVIYLEKKNFSSVGKGCFKNFNRGLLYNVSSPEIVATGFLKVPKKNSFRRRSSLREAEVMKKLQGERGIVKFYSILTHKNISKKNDEIVFVEKLYNGGSIRKLLKKHDYSFTKSEKIKIAADFIAGVRAIHKRGMIHGDLHTGNYLIDVEKRNKKRKVAGAIIDFAKVRYFDKRLPDSRSRKNPAFPHASHDINKLGRALHGLFHNYNPRRGEGYLKPIKAYGHKFDKKHKGSRHSADRRFESLIMRMLNIKDKKRINSKDVYEEMRKINGKIK